MRRDVELTLRGIRARGRHGASPGETDRPQEFVVDLEVVVDVGADRLDATADYRALARTARAAVEDEPVVLLETLAGRVADAVARLDRVVRVRAIVHKLRAAESVEAEDVSAAAIREAAR
jgi:dihydroneopterin aldolase